MKTYHTELPADVADSLVGRVLEDWIKVQARQLLNLQDEMRGGGYHHWEDIQDCLEVVAAANRLLVYLGLQPETIVAAVREADKNDVS